MTTKDYLQAVFGTDEGTAHAAFGSGGHVGTTSGRYEFDSWTPTTFAWPREADALERALTQAAAAGDDVYVCPYLMHGRKRAQGAAVARRIVHADVDHGSLDLEAVRALGGYAVGSGSPGNGHVYVPLERAVTAAEHTVLCRGLGDYLGGADAKISDNDVLRPPGTVNGKHEPPAAVSWLVQPSGHRWAPEALAERLGVSLAAPQAVATAAAGVEPVDVPSLDQRVRNALADVTDDRSADTMRVVGACHDAGLTLPQTRYVLADRTDLAQRLAERTDDDVLTCWLKVTDARVQRAAERRRESEWVAELVGGATASPAAPVDPDEDAAARARRLFPRLDWHELWADDEAEEWLHEPLLPARRSVVIYSPPKVGKSLLMLEFAVALSRGETFLSSPIERRYRVLYVDYENDPRGDVRGRLMAMGYGPDDLDHLIYLSFPALNGLDTERGSLELLEAVMAYEAEVVVIDTVSRAVDGEENSNDTWLGLYRHTGLKLKQAGVSVIRLDHSGKDESKGQRGGSAKSGDVDMIWRLSKITDERFRLECTDARLPVETKSLHVIRQRLPRLTHTAEVLGAVTDREAKIAHVIELANSNGIPADAGRDIIRGFAKERGIKARNDLFAEVAKRRKAGAEGLAQRAVQPVPTLGDRSSDTDLSPASGTARDSETAEPRNAGQKSCPQPQGTTGDNPPSPHLSPGQQSLAAPVGTAGHGEEKSTSDDPSVCAYDGCTDPPRPDKQMCAMHRTFEPAGVNR